MTNGCDWAPTELCLQKQVVPWVWPGSQLASPSLPYHIFGVIPILWRIKLRYREVKRNSHAKGRLDLVSSQAQAFYLPTHCLPCEVDAGWGRVDG